MFDVFSQYPTPTLVLLFGASFVAGTARGFSGFGSALILVPLASAAIGPDRKSTRLNSSHT